MSPMLSAALSLLLVNRQHVMKGTADSVQLSNMSDRNQASAQTQTFHTNKGGKRPYVKICEIQGQNCLKEWEKIRLVSLLFSVWHPSFLYKWFSLGFFFFCFRAKQRCTILTTEVDGD